MEVERRALLIQKLAAILSSSLNSLEILPCGLEEWTSTNSIEEDKRPTPDFPFLYSGGNLGIPKKVLYKLYMDAVALFKASRSVPELCRVSTCIILLTNPGHQTALNARKRLVQNGGLDPAKELEFTQVLLRGSSDCAKQSIFWDHRRWLLGRVYTGRLQLRERHPNQTWPTTADLRALPDVLPDIIISELSLVRNACESHPRNYHAWMHWQFILEIVHAQLSLRPEISDVYFNILNQEFTALSRWVDLHISDHSAIYRLCNLGRLFGDLEPCYPIRNKDPLAANVTNTTLVNHALSLIVSYPTHESLWIYLRESSLLLPMKDRGKLVEQIEALSMSENPLAKRFMQWISISASASSGGGPLHIHRTDPECTNI